MPKARAAVALWVTGDASAVVTRDGFGEFWRHGLAEPGRHLVVRCHETRGGYGLAVCAWCHVGSLQRLGVLHEPPCLCGGLVVALDALDLR